MAAPSGGSIDHLSDAVSGGAAVCFLVVVCARSHPHVRRLSLSPRYRELAVQIHSVVAAFVTPNKEDDTPADGAADGSADGEGESDASVDISELHAFELCALIGGSDQTAVEQRFIKRGGNIVIATPGRLKATFEGVLKDVFDVSRLEVLILDEADRLLDMGFETTITSILKRLPKQRRTGLFSATQTQRVKDLARAGLRNPVQVDVRVQYKPKLLPDGTDAPAADFKANADRATPTR